MKINVLRATGLVGTLIFLPIFIFTLLDPHFVERTGRGFIEWKVKSEAEQRVASIEVNSPLLNPSLLKKRLDDIAFAKSIGVDARLSSLTEQLQQAAPKLIAEQIARVSNIHCECRKAWQTRLNNAMGSRLASLGLAKQKLVDFTQGKYMEVVHKLTMDVRIFSATNTVVFILLLMVSLVRPQTVNHLFLPGGLLAISTAVCSFFYVFEQNWVYTIIYNDYTGFAYLGYLTFVFALLSDIVLNRGRVTTEIVNALLDAVGSAASLSPC